MNVDRTHNIIAVRFVFLFNLNENLSQFNASMIKSVIIKQRMKIKSSSNINLKALKAKNLSIIITNIQVTNNALTERYL